MKTQSNQIKMSKDSHKLVQNIKKYVKTQVGFDSLCEDALRDIYEVNNQRQYPISISWSYTPDLKDFLIGTTNIEEKSRYWYSKNEETFQYFIDVVPHMIGDWVLHNSVFYPQHYVETIQPHQVEENALIGAVLHRMLRSGMFKKDETLLLDSSSREIFNFTSNIITVILTLWVWEPGFTQCKCVEEKFSIDFRNGTYNSSSKIEQVRYKDEIVQEFQDQSLEQDDFEFEWDERER